MEKYYEFKRSELLDLVPLEAKLILDVGCACGCLGKEIKSRQKACVVGIERNRSACDEARKNINYVIHEDLDYPDEFELQGVFDCVIFADVLEHLKDPTKTIRKILKNTNDKTVFIFSIPNIAHESIKKELSNDLWRYQVAGILDQTHLRNFTLSTFTQLMCHLGLKVKLARSYPSENDSIQFHIVCKLKNYVKKKNGVSVLISNVSAVEYLKQIVESIRECTEGDYKIYCIDNNSKDGSVEYLRAQDDILHIESTKILSFARSYNMLMTIAPDDYICLVNNDIVVTPEWNKRLTNHFNMHSDLGLIGPVSNFASGLQIKNDIKYKSKSELYNEAEKIYHEGLGGLRFCDRVAFFCVILKRELLVKVGFLDERFDPGNFEDDDYCLRTKKAGLKIAYCSDVFVHHYGSVTFKKRNLDYNRILQEQKNVFYAKWKYKE
jgi:GT2 family glycosyltransferase/trans-aconitate methyltransferase